MKKRFITLLVVIVMVATLLVVFTSCGDDTQTTTSTKTEVGSYSLFQTRDVEEYLSFLENFDETKYEIVDISTGRGALVTDEYYMVTYKKIAE